jgi:hypothetical protein
LRATATIARFTLRWQAMAMPQTSDCTTSLCKRAVPGLARTAPCASSRRRIFNTDKAPTYAAALVPRLARGLPLARTVADTLVLLSLAIVVMLSERLGAIASILLAFGSMATALVFSARWPPTAETLLRRGGNVIAFAALAWVVSHAVYASGRITYHRL